ncbi:AcrR family transcriptional regulator [Microbacterium terrae]|uniref:HTH-type transcriptional regulator TtgR n=1 Tax=Microbacterium terrae TaxID=69369 RepID=A0A0M2H1V2_9MICO|nr:TetR/AcrR family transcriptional regulator [Microbacterium terrae]KJL37543.1 HTH-type transcriptional regulator TtgR [Microbacterium terrae]MBP1076373.1 AcrR family transcriptional regulator [Microbacterium terrae]GLJ97197.1 TetR family transcriptional regulator [Microbacterium terrae]
MVVTKYPKGIAKTEEILTVALRVVAEKGYNRATIRELAEAAGLSKTGLLHHFGSKEELFAEILRRRDQSDEAQMQSGVTEGSAPQLADLPRISASVPGLVQLYTRFSAEASDPEHSAHAFFRDRYERARRRSQEVLEGFRADGRLPESVDPARAATALVALLDGIQLQWLYDPESIDMVDEVQYFLAQLGLKPTPDPTA